MERIIRQDESVTQLLRPHGGLRRYGTGDAAAVSGMGVQLSPPSVE
jgi:hypothetical protein